MFVAGFNIGYEIKNIPGISTYPLGVAFERAN